MKHLHIAIITVFLVGSIFTSCKKDSVSTNGCDTCNLNKDSLAHAFTWTEYIGKIPGETDLKSCWVFGQNDIFLLGSSLWHYNGTSFTLVPAYCTTRNGQALDGGLDDYKIFAFRNNKDFWLIGGEVLHTKDGENFDDVTPAYTNSCWGESSNDMFFVGKAGRISNQGVIYHYDGTTSTQMTSNTTKPFRWVWGRNSSDVWACGFDSSTAERNLLHYDGTSWTDDIFSTSGQATQYGIGSAWACDSLGHSIAVIAGTRVFHKTDNGVWRSDTSEVGNSLGGGNYINMGVFGGTSTDLFAYGNWGFISHWNGKTWMQYKQFFDHSNNDYSTFAFSMNGNTACAVGTKNGASWILVGQRSQ